MFPTHVFNFPNARLIDEVVKQTRIVVDDFNIHRLFVTCFLLSFKINEDDPPRSSEIAKTGGYMLFSERLLFLLLIHICCTTHRLLLSELNSLEIKTLKMVNWSLIILPKNYELYCRLMVDYHRQRQRID